MSSPNQYSDNFSDGQHFHWPDQEGLLKELHLATGDGSNRERGRSRLGTAINWVGRVSVAAGIALISMTAVDKYVVDFIHIGGNDSEAPGLGDDQFAPFQPPEAILIPTRPSPVPGD